MPEGAEGRYPMCWSTMSILSQIAATILSLTYLGLLLIIGMFYFNFDFGLQDSLSRSYNIMHLMFRIYSIGLVALDEFLPGGPNSNKRLIVYVAQVLFGLIFGVDYFKRFPYYNLKVSAIYCLSLAAYSWIALIVLISHLISADLITNNMLYITLIGLIFCMYLMRTYRTYFYRRLVINDLDDITSELHLYTRFRYLLQIDANKEVDTNDGLLITSLIKEHLDKCLDAQCMCKNRKDLHDPKSKANCDLDVPSYKDTVFIKHFMQLMVKKSLIKMPKSSLLNIAYCLYLASEMENIPLANQQILIFETQLQQNLFVTAKYAIFRIKIGIYYHIKDKNKGSPVGRLKFENIRWFDEKMRLMKASAAKVIELYCKMWDALGELNCDVTAFDKVCRGLSDEKTAAEKNFFALAKLAPNSVNLLNLMTLYANFVVFDDLLLMTLHESVKVIVGNTKPMAQGLSASEYIENLYNMQETSCSIAIGLTNENLGQILWSSDSCQTIFGFDSNYFKSFNIRAIMPGSISKKHDLFVSNFIQTSHFRSHFKLNSYWAINKDRNLMAIYVSLKTFVFNEGLAVRSDDADSVTHN